MWWTFQRFLPNRTATYAFSFDKTASNRTVGFSQNEMHTARQRRILQLEKPHRGSVLRREIPSISPRLYGEFLSYGACGAVRCGISAPHRRILEQQNPHRIAPHREKQKTHLTAPHRTAPHRTILWQSVEHAFLTVRIELIRGQKTPRTVWSNYVNRIKCHF